MRKICSNFPQKTDIDRLGLLKKIYAARKLILTVCGIGAIVGMVIGSGIPKEYTASIFIVPENSRRNAFGGMSALSDMAGIGANSSSAIERDAVYSVLYPDIVHSTPFLVRLFDVKVREQTDSTEITLSRYLKERQKRPWWNVITSAPSRLTGWGISLFRKKPEADKAESRIDIFRLTREEAGMVGSIASRIGIEVKETSMRRGKITLSVTMQDPLVAATVADTILAHLKEYITEYRTAKACRMLEYTEKLRKEAQAEYYEVQEKYTRYADANQELARLASRAELIELRNEMNLALATYNQAELQVQVAEAKVKRMIPVLAVIQPAVVPLSPSKPRKMLILVACVLLGGAGSMGWILFGKDLWKKTRDS